MACSCLIISLSSTASVKSLKPTANQSMKNRSLASCEYDFVRYIKHLILIWQKKKPQQFADHYWTPFCLLY